jgi:fatty-acyl-CoA synthase
MTIVHPSANYDGTATLKAIQLKRCTSFPGVPSMLNALLSHPDFKKTDTSCMEHISLGSTMILPEHFRRAPEDFGARRSTEGYGMTEGGVLWIHTRGSTPKDTYPCPVSKMKIAI